MPTEEQRLEREAAGWEIVSIEPMSGDERHFGLVIQKNGKRKCVTIHGTELGWWMGKIEKRKAK